LGIPTTVRYSIKLLLPILIISVLFGGVEKSHADDRKLFLIQITRENSKAVTTMHVRATDIEEARSQIVLNGWVLLKIEEKPDNNGVPNHKFRYTGPAKAWQSDKLASVSSDKNGITDNSTNGVKFPTDIRTALSDSSTALLADDNYTYIGSVYFDLGRFSTETTADLIDKSKQGKSSEKYLILGHTDTVRVIDNNHFDTNFDLSRKRADFLKSVLIRNGISAVNISVEGMGTLMPAADNTDKGQPMNRRADLYGRN
jgi:outer membrane protein OmpA-like peptidoglycan-associated protein